MTSLAKKLTPSPALVKQSLASHSWIGLLCGALMYLVCLSGALAVFYLEFERWEQPQAEEFLDYEPAMFDAAHAEALARDPEATEHVYIGLPRAEMPRATVATDNTGWFLNRDGSLGGEVAHDWTHILVDLHLFLHLPESWGMIVVSLLGVLLCGLIASGLLAHPRLFKDAFSLRLRGSKRMEQVDIHNRLSVWGLPFHLMIAVTGAYFGLAALVVLVIAQVTYDGDIDKVTAAIFGPEPVLEQQLDGPAAVGSAIRQVEQMAPGAKPFYVTLEEVGTPEQFMLVGAEYPERLIYAEQFRFDSSGNYLSKVGFSDGEAGKQAIFSVYRLHFGHFGGLWVKVAYLLLGIAITVISVTGINIWFARRKTRDSLNSLWTGFVWGTPLALAASAITQVLLGIPSTAVFWVVLLAACGYSRLLDADRRARRHLLWASAGTLLVLVAGHALSFGASALSGAALWVNLSLLVTSLCFALGALRPIRPCEAARVALADPA